jgi:hypothetical protein
MGAVAEIGLRLVDALVGVLFLVKARQSSSPLSVNAFDASQGPEAELYKTAIAGPRIRGNHMPVFARELGTADACRMMEALGIEPGGSVVPRWGLLYSAVFRRCQSCPSKSLCRKCLDRDTHLASLPPSFCPSSDALFELQYLQLAARGFVFSPTARR